MAETPSIKVQFEYQNPTNVEAEVPGAQKFRGASEGTLNDSAGGTEEDENKPQYSARSISYTEVRREVVKDGQVISTDYQVISDNRNGESDKKITEERRSKTRIPKFKQTVEKVKAERRGSKDKKDHETHIPVRRSSIPKPTKESKIPPPTIKKEVIITKTEIKRQITEPDDEFDKIYEEIVASTPTKVVVDDKLLYNKVDDQDKLETKFEEIIHDYDENKVQPINVERVRRSKIPFFKRKSQQEIDVPHAMDRTSKIIAARDKIRLKNAFSRPIETSNNVEPDNEVKNQVVTHRYTKTVTTKQVSVDNENGNEPPNDVKTSTFINETYNIDTNENISDIKAESKNNEEIVETNEKIVKSNIEIPVIIPVYKSYVKEHTETQETEKTVKIKKSFEWMSSTDDIEMKRESFTSNIHKTKTPEIYEFKNETPKYDVTSKDLDIKADIKTYENIDTLLSAKTVASSTESIDTNNKTEDNEAPVKEKDSSIEEELAELRGKVSRIINKIDSKEVSESDTHKKDFNNEIPKKKTIMSRIAMFERLEPDEPFPRPRATRSETKLSKIVTKDVEMSKTEHVHVHTPKIVEEVFKPFQDKSDLDNQADKIEVIDDDTNAYKTDITAIENEEKIEIKTKNVILEKSAISEETLTPMQFASNDIKQQLSPVVLTKTFDDRVKLPEHLKEDVVLYKKIEYTKSIDNNAKETHLTVQNSTSDKEILSDFASVPNQITRETEKTIVNENIRPINLIFSEFELNNNSVRDEKNKNHEVFANIPNDLENRSKIRSRTRFDDDDLRKAKSLAELDLGDAVKGKVNRMIVRMKSEERFDVERKEVISIKEMPRKRSVSEKIALFERKLTSVKNHAAILTRTQKIDVKPAAELHNAVMDNVEEKIAELKNAKLIYGRVPDMPSLVLRTGAPMPVLAMGTAMLDPRLIPHIIGTAIDLGFRAIDCAFIYGNEKVVGDAIKAKIADGTVTRDELFIISKLWSTFHRSDLVESACRASLSAMGLDYFDLYLIHNPMSFKEGPSPLPKIATVLQYSEHDYMDAWYGMEELVSKGLSKAIGVSNFNSVQIQRIMDKGRVKPAVNQVECHPYLSQQSLHKFCTERNITLSCFGALGSKGTPLEYKSGLPPVIDDSLVQVMASGLNITAAQLLIRYQLECGHNVVVKSSSGAHLWDILQALKFNLTSGQVDALHALNRNKRIFTFKGMGDTHKNYPFNIAF